MCVIWSEYPGFSTKILGIVLSSCLKFLLIDWLSPLSTVESKIENLDNSQVCGGFFSFLFLIGKHSGGNSLSKQTEWVTRNIH